MTRLADLTWPEAVALAPGAVLVVAVGSTEQHGPHLPLDTDLRIAAALTEQLAAERPTTVLVGPSLAVTSSGEHASFTGTLSIGGPAVEQVLVELARSADAFAGVLFVHGHGGNAEPARRAAATLRAEGRRVRSWWPAGPGLDAHAGCTETSLLLHLDPGAVRQALVAPGDLRPLGELLPLLREGGVAAVTATGVLGDPTLASADQGAELVRRWVTELALAADELSAGVPARP